VIPGGGVATPRVPGDAASPAHPPRSLRERWLATRERLLSDPRLQRWAAGFPLTRGIARRRARALFDLCAGFVYSQVLDATVKLGLIERLAGRPADAATLARELCVPPDAMLRLLEAARVLELLERRSGAAWGLGPLGAALHGNPAVTAMIEHHRILYADLADPVALLRGQTDPGLARYWAYAGAQAPGALAPEAVADYTTLMSRSQSLVADTVLGAHPLAGYRCLLDVGGGDGTFARAALASAPALAAIVFDLPAVAARATAAFAGAGLGTRARAVGGDFTRDALPTGADVISLVRVLHDHDDDTVRGLLARAAQALAPGGTLLVAEPFAEAPGAEAVGAAYFGLYLLAMGRGRARSPAELAALLVGAGFDAVQQRTTHQPLQCGLLVARRTGRP
jgi:demethylspheroidene O-methyltransferase